MAILYDHKRKLLALLGLVVVAALVYAAWLVFELIRPQTLTVDNRSDGPVSIIVGTRYRMDVEPQTAETLNTGWFPPSTDAFIVYANGTWKSCDWSDAAEHGLLVDSAGAQCADLGGDWSPLPIDRGVLVTPASQPPATPAPP